MNKQDWNKGYKEDQSHAYDITERNGNCAKLKNATPLNNLLRVIGKRYSDS